MGLVTYNGQEEFWNIFREEGGVFSGNLALDAAFDYFRDNCQVNDALYFGHNPRFHNLYLYVGTPFQAQAKTFAWEYWNGSAWTGLAVGDGTNGYANPGAGSVAFLPPTDWGNCLVNSVNCMWVRCRLAAVTSPTEGGANSTVRARFGNNLLTVDDYSEALPCILEDLFIFSQANGWNVVSRLDVHYFLNARLQVGRGDRAAWLIDTNKCLSFPHIGVPWTNQEALSVAYLGHARFGKLLDPANKIGGQGCMLDPGPQESINIRCWSGGSLDLFGCQVRSRKYAQVAHSENVRLYNTIFTMDEGASEGGIYNLSNSDVQHCQFLGAAMHELQASCTIGANLLLRNAGVVIFGYWPALEYRDLTIYGAADYLFSAYYDSGQPFRFINCTSPTWRILWFNNRQPVKRQHTLDLLTEPGAAVTVRDAFGNQAPGSPFTADENGRIPQQALDYQVFAYEAGQPDDTRITTYSPYTLKIEKSGLTTYEDVLDMSKPQDLAIALMPVTIQQALNNNVSLGMQTLKANVKLSTPTYRLKVGVE